MGRIAEAAASGGRRELLLAMKMKIAEAMDACESARDLPALARREMEIDAELAALPDPGARKTRLAAMQDARR